MEAADFLPTQLTNKDYPMIPVGQTVDTLAVSAVLAAFNWPSDTDRYRRTAAFIDAFFDRIGEFHKPPRHPKWKEVNISANLPGWTRHPAAQAWIDRHRTAGQ